jgi:S1-C subfamily serine protease
LTPSTLEPDADGVVLTRYRLRGQRLEPTAAPIARRTSLRGRDAAVLDGALVFGTPFRADELGSPVLDAAGEVVAIVAEACSPRVADGCRLEPYGAPVAVLREFLRSAPPRRPLPAAWLGFRGVSGHVGQVAGVRVIDVQPGSAAEKAGLLAVGSARPDLVVAVNGQPVDSFDELSALVNRAALKPAGAGDAAARSVRLLVFGGERFREVELTLRPPRQAPIATGSTAGAAADERTEVEASVAASPSAPRSPPSPAQPRLAPTPYDPTPKNAEP